MDKHTVIVKGYRWTADGNGEIIFEDATLAASRETIYAFERAVKAQGYRFYFSIRKGYNEIRKEETPRIFMYQPGDYDRAANIVKKKIRRAGHSPVTGRFLNRGQS